MDNIIPPNTIENWKNNDYRDMQDVMNKLYSFVNRISGKSHWAEEAVQETMYKVFTTGLETFYPGADSDPWLRQIALNKLRDIARRETNHVNPSLDNIIQGSDSLSSHYELIPSTPQHTENSELNHEANKIINYLDENHDKDKKLNALYLREVQGLNYNQIAISQKIPVGTVKSRISSAKSEVRHIFPNLSNKYSA